MAYYAKTVVVDMTPMTEEPEFSVLSLRQLEEISGQYRCAICLRDPHEAHICPKCTTIFGKGCLYTAYKVFNATSCPHCRRDVALDTFVRSPDIDILAKMLRHALPLPKKCGKHPTKYVEFVCHTCSVCVCGICCSDDHSSDDHNVDELPAYEFAQHENSKLIQE